MNSNLVRTQVGKVIETIVREGAGTEENLTRHVFYYHDLHGQFLAKYDPCEDKEEKTGILKREE